MKLQQYNNTIDVFALGMTWLQMSLPELWYLDSFYDFWKALVSPRNGEEWLSPRALRSILVERFSGKLGDDLLILASKVLCEPNRRLDADTFFQEFTKLAG